VAHPPHLGDGVHEEAAQGGPAGRGDLSRPIPHSPPFVVNGKVGRCQRGQSLEQEGPVLFCQGIHLTVEGDNAAVGIFHFSVLVATDMHQLPSNRGFLW